MMKKVFIVLIASTMFIACGNNQQAKKIDGKDDCCAKKECTSEKAKTNKAVCIGKAIENMADFEGKEAVFNAKIVKCQESGNFYASACEGEGKAIELIPAENVVLADAVDKNVTLTGKLTDGKVQVSELVLLSGSCSGDKEAKAGCEGGCCADKKAVVES